ncbi:MAG TPA: hypothetical protein VFI96_07055, partial [Longimicrobiaceae bacterium]|nr:hypothetical protein [Longimicrobiaceae bacterium]
MAKENGFVRWVQLRYDKTAGKRMQEEAELAMEAAGKGGAKELTEALAEGGKKGARALTTALNKEYRARMAAARKSFAEGLIDEAAYKKAGEEAALAYNKGLSSGIKQLKGSKLGLSELQGTQLAGKFKLPTGGAKAGGMMGGLGGLMAGAAGPLVGLFAAGKLKDVALEMRDLGTAAEEAGNKFQTTFGDAAPQVQTFLDSWAEMAGLDETAAHDLSATAGAVAEGMGLTQSASAGMSQQVMKLAGDLASFNNVPIEQAFQSVIGGLTGERDSLKQFGIVIQQSEVDQRALANSHKTSTDALTAQEKALASMQLMMEKAGVQVGDLERTQDSNANTQKRLTAEFKNAKIEIAKELLPAYSDMLGFVDDNSAALGTLAKFVGGILIVAVRAASKVLVFLADVVLGGLDGAIGGVVLALAALVKGAGEAMGAVARLSELTGIGDSKAWRERADAIDRTAEALKKFGLQAAENGNRALRTAFSGHNRDTGGGAPATPTTPASVVVHTPRSTRKTTGAGSTATGTSSEGDAAFTPHVV